MCRVVPAVSETWCRLHRTLSASQLQQLVGAVIGTTPRRQTLPARGTRPSIFDTPPQWRISIGIHVEPWESPVPARLRYRLWSAENRISTGMLKEERARKRLRNRGYGSALRPKRGYIYPDCNLQLLSLNPELHGRPPPTLPFPACQKIDHSRKDRIRSSCRELNLNCCGGCCW